MNMLRVLLVDDEPFILQGLAVIIDWNKEGFEVVGKASNGLEALEFLRKEKVDLVIADIKMPEMTGLELLEKVRQEKLSDAYFVVLSGYSDFEYARRALQNECLDYMLKPVEQGELVNVLGRVRQIYETSSRKREDDSVMECEAFARNMIPICHGRYRPDNVEYVQKYVGGGKNFRYISVELDGGHRNIRQLTADEKRKLQKELYQKCILLFPGREYLCVLNSSIREEIYNVAIIYVGGLLCGSDEESEQEYIDQLQGKLKKSVGFPVEIIIGKRVDHVEEISESCRSVLLAHSLKGFDLGEKPNWELSGHLLDRQLADTLVRAVKLNDKEGISDSYSMLSQEMKKSGMDVHMVNMVVNHLMFEFLHLALEQDENIDRQEILRFRNDDEGLAQLLLEYGDYLMELRSNQSGEILGRIEEDIRRNYKENLTLKDLGKKYFINSAYLGQTFKKQYGESFKDHLNRIRIEAAERLLLYSDKKIYEIAEEVGYKDMDYFINKFIALKGCTPAKFRRQVK